MPLVFGGKPGRLPGEGGLEEDGHCRHELREHWSETIPGAQLPLAFSWGLDMCKDGVGGQRRNVGWRRVFGVLNARLKMALDSLAMSFS